MYDTETPALQGQQECSVDAWMRAAAYAAGTKPELEQIDLGQAVESKKRDNLVLGQALLSIGLIGRRELEQVRSAQAESDGLVEALRLASALRSRLGEMLLKSQRITSAQLEYALELQRCEGGLLGEILLSLGWLDRQTLDATLAAQATGRAD